ncbi:helix-turn-helix domain-containing protein [Salinisphaera orenii]|uniref:helix-turn-helix domain-containing protein n=1 Tax=Salinisphaera orenii TaxID=856731 RepID=UPI000DBE9FAE
MNHVYMGYAIAADTRLRSRARLAQFLIYMAMRGGQDGIAWASSSSIARHLGVDRKNVSRLRKDSVEMGYLVEIGHVRQATKYRVQVPDVEAILDAVADATARSETDQSEMLEGARALITPTLSPPGALIRYQQAEVIVGADRLARRYCEIQANNERPHQAWRTYVADILRHKQ